MGGRWSRAPVETDDDAVETTCSRRVTRLTGSTAAVVTTIAVVATMTVK
jgi:hypothetical protein